MKAANPAPGRPERIQRGLASTLRATGRGITVRDNGVDVEPVWDVILGQGLKATDLDDGAVRIDAAGGTGPDGGTSSSPPIPMLNNSGQTLLPGDVVVVDETADKAVTVTTTEGDTRIAGVVQEPIDVGEIGLVLFNGFTPLINDTAAVRGEYAKTATSAAQSIGTADREAGSFAVYLTGANFAEFASDSLTTTAAIPVVELDIDMPASIPADRELFLALWLEDTTSSVSVPDWTLIGAEAGFYYYRKVSEGDDTATATWTTASTAVATVLLLHPSVFLADPVADHDYDDTTSAAAVAGLDTSIPKYAIAGVQSDVDTPGSGYIWLGGGTAGFAASGSTTLEQSNDGDGGTGGTSFDDAPTIGNMLVAVPWIDTAGLPATVSLYDPRDPGSCPEVTDWADNAHFFGSTTGGATAAFYTKIADETYAGPFKNSGACTADAARSSLTLLEFTGVSEVAAVLGPTDDVQNNTIDLGTFADYGADDVIVMAVAFKIDGGGDPAVSFAAEGFTQLVDDAFQMSSAFRWLGYKIGGTANAKVTHSGGASYNWGASAIHLTAGTQGTAGTLAGKYIGTDATATSPFTGSNTDDAIFAFNLLTEAKPSALLYGPDLGGADGGEPTADDHIADTSDAHDASAISLLDSGGYFTAADVEAGIAELAAKDIGYSAHGNMGATETFSALTGWHSGTFDADCTFTFSGATSGVVASMVLELTEDGTGGWQPTWPGSVVWPGGTPPTHDDTAGTTTIYLFESRDGGTTWYGFQAGAGGSSVAALDDLTDVNAPSPSDGNVLTWDSTPGEWVAAPPTTVGDLDDLSDVTITGPAVGDLLRYDGAAWVNYSGHYEPVIADFGSGPELVFDGGDIVMEWFD